MKISDIFGMSLVNLWRRKTRTILTILGVVIGTASIVVMLSLGLGLKKAMLAEVSTAGGLTEIWVSGDSDSEQLLLDDEAVAKFEKLDYVESVEPQLNYYMPLKAGKYESYDVDIIGVSKTYMKKMELEQGKLPEKDESGQLSIAVGNQVVSDFYDSTTGQYFEGDELPDIDLINSPVFGGISIETSDETEADTGQTVENDVDPIFAEDTDDDFSAEGDFDDFQESSESSSQAAGMLNNNLDFDSDDNVNNSVFSSDVRRVPIKVTGILGGEDTEYTEYSYACYTDMDTLKAFLKKNYSENTLIPGQPSDRSGKPYRTLKYNQLVVNVDKSDNVEEVLETIQDMGYRAEANKEWLDQIEQEFMIIEAVLGGIGAVAMLVAAISIANTMTMSTYERTKEIGVMKVLGCSLSNIRSMFLTEAAFIGLLGGMVGIGLSYILSVVLNQFVAPTVMSDYGYGENMNISVIPIWLVAVAIAFATVIGMLAGFFPAQRATSLSPLAAIRNE